MKRFPFYVAVLSLTGTVLSGCATTCLDAPGSIEPWEPEPTYYGSEDEFVILAETMGYVDMACLICSSCTGKMRVTGEEDAIFKMFEGRFKRKLDTYDEMQANIQARMAGGERAKNTITPHHEDCDSIKRDYWSLADSVNNLNRVLWREEG